MPLAVDDDLYSESQVSFSVFKSSRCGRFEVEDLKIGGCEDLTVTVIEGLNCRESETHHWFDGGHPAVKGIIPGLVGCRRLSR